jgi:hypothetical protein
MIELEIGKIVVSYVSVALICLSMYIVDKKIIYYCIWAHTLLPKNLKKHATLSEQFQHPIETIFWALTL